MKRRAEQSINKRYSVQLEQLTDDLKDYINANTFNNNNSPTSDLTTDTKIATLLDNSTHTELQSRRANTFLFIQKPDGAKKEDKTNKIQKLYVLD